MNKDVKTFDGMVAALRYHMYQHVLIANIGEFGGSTAQAPYDKEHRRLISHSHGSEQLAYLGFRCSYGGFRAKTGGSEAWLAGTQKGDRAHWQGSSSWLEAVKLRTCSKSSQQ